MANELEFLNTLPDQSDTERENLSGVVIAPEEQPTIQETPTLPGEFLDTIPDNESDLTKSFQNIPEQDPDKTAKIMNVSRETGEPEIFVQENLDEIEIEAKKPTDEDWRKIENENPDSSNWLKKDSKNMSLAHDDIEPLTKNESIFKELEFATKLLLDPTEKIRIANGMAKGQVDPIRSGFTSGVLQVKQSQLGWKQMTNALVTGKHSGIGDNELIDIEKKLSEHAEKEPGFNPFYFASQQVPNMMLMGLKGVERGAQAGIVFGLGAAAIGQMGPQIAVPEEVVTVPAAFATGVHIGGRIGALEAAAILEGGSAYREFIKLKDKNGNGVNPRQAAEMALAVGVVNAGLEYVSAKALLKTIPGGERILKHFSKNKSVLAGLSPGIAVKNAAKNYLINIGTEVVTEVGQEAVTGFGREILKKLDPKLVFKKFNAKSFLSDISRVISPAAQASLLLGSPGTLTTVAKEVNKMSKTDLNKEVYDAIGENADNSKLAERSKEAFSDQVQTMAEGVDATETIMSVESFQKKSADIGLDPLQLALELEIDEYYQEALNNDAELVVPTGEWTANTKKLEKEIGQPIYSAFSEDVKFNHDEYTKREQREIGEYYQDQFKSEADKIASNDPEVENVRKQIQEKTFNELVEAGTKKDVAKAQSLLYADMVLTTTSRVEGATVDEVTNSMVKEVVGVDEIVKQSDAMAQFAGLKSMTSDNLKLDQAIGRIGTGEDANIVRQETGWFQGQDGKYRYEISDDQAKFTFDEKGALGSDIIFKSQRGRLTLGDLIVHDELYKAYPFLESVQVNYNPHLKTFEGITAYYHPGSKTLNLSPDAIKNKSAIMHEIQHAIQNYEGFDGADTVGALIQTKEDVAELEERVAEMEEAFTEMQNYNDPERDEDIGIYQRMGFINKLNRDKAILEQVKGQKPSGEKEAGATGERANLTAEQRLAEAPAIMVVNGKEIPVKSQELFQEPLDIQTPEFKKWFGDSKVVDDEGKPLVLYHGTTHKFESFERERGNIENHYGKAIYFTDSELDVEENYEGLGPDLTNRVESRAERILQEKYDDDQEQMDKAMGEAKTELVGGEGQVISAYIKMENPVVLVGDDQTQFEFEYDEETDEESGNWIELNEAVLNTANEYNLDGQSIWGSLELESEFTAAEFEAKMRASEEVLYIEDDNGNLASNEFIADVYRNFGFDGIIMDADVAFGNQRKTGKPMAMDDDTRHYIVFNSEQVKGTENRGTFDPSDPRILYQEKKAETFYSKDGLTISEYIKKEKLPEQKTIPEKGSFSFVRTDDGGIYFDEKDGPHALIIENQKIPAERVTGGGFIVDGVETSSQSPNALAIGEQARAKKRVEFRKKLDKQNQFKSRELYQEKKADTFYSKLEQTIIDKMPEKSNKQQIIGIVKNAGVKQEEIDWIGLPEFLEENPKVTKQEVIEFIQANNVKLQEVVKGTKEQLSSSELARMEELASLGVKRNEVQNNEFKTLLKRDNEDFAKENSTKFSNYQLPGGENYTETLLILPQPTFKKSRKVDEFEARMKAKYKVNTIQEAKDLITKEEKDEYEIALNKAFKKRFRTSHFEEGNILAHIRHNERVDNEGNKVLFLEEIQSDWHQKGRKEGYAGDVKTLPDTYTVLTPEIKKSKGYLDTTGFGVLNKNGQSITFPSHRTKDAAIKEALEVINKGEIPNAPFKKTWHELALKRMIRHASEKGFDKIAWTTGEQQAERYDLSKQVDSIRIEKLVGGDLDGYYYLQVMQNGSVVLDRSVTEKELPDIVGKDLATKAINDVKDYPDGKEYSGLDLKVGGEGMKGFYDKIMPSYLNKLGKKYGAKVERIMVDTTEKGDQQFVNRDIPVGDISVHSLEITDKMKDAALLEGFPLFQGQQKGQPLGSYNATTKKVMLAMKSADASTFVHEMSHAWLKFTSDMNNAGRLTENYQKDWNTLSKWLEVKEGQTEFTIEQQEKFARGFEAYLQEGKAPKVELISAFSKFKRWLMKIYESITHPSIGLINKSELAEDVKGVMDRMFATEEEIKASEYYLNYDKDLDITGIDPKVKEKLSEFKEKAHEQATAKLLAEQMEELSSERKEAIAKFRKESADSFENELRVSSLYRAIEVLNTWKKPGVVTEFETEPVQVGKKYRELGSVKKMANKFLASELDEIKTDMFNIVAEALEFYSGEDLANQIVNKKDLKNEVDSFADRQVAKSFPELMDTDAIRDQAIEALHDDKQLEIMAIEREILNSMVGDAQARTEAQRYGQTKAWMEADIARQKAENYLLGLKTKAISRVSKYITAERVNAVKALKAIKRKDYASAADFKQRQMINHALALGVIKLQKKKANIDKQINKIARKKQDKFADQNAYEQVKFILNRFGLSYEVNEAPAISLSEYLKELTTAYMGLDDESTPLDVVDWLLDDSKEGEIADLTINQYQELLNSVKNIIHVSNSVNKFYRMAGQRNIIETIDSLAAVATKNIKPRKRPRAIRTKFEHIKNNIEDYLFSLEQIDTVLGRLDGWEDFGPWQNAISEPVKEAANAESDMRFAAKDKLKEIWSVYSKNELNDLFKKKLTVPQFGVDKENPVTKQQLIAMALNLGNETNKDRLFDTPPVGFYPEFEWSRDNRIESEAVITSILEEHLTEKDWSTVQNLWDMINGYWPEISKLHREITGFEPVKVEATPFEITQQNGKRKAFKGGYYPLVGDPRYNEQIAVRELTGQPLYEEINPAHKAMTKTGHTKTRTNAKYAISLNLDIINRHLNDVIHDLAFRPLIYDLRRIASNRGFVDTVKKHTGDSGYRYIKQWIGAVAAGGNTEKFATDQLSRAVRWANNRQTYVIILGRISILTQNFANVLLAPNRVKGFGYSDTIKGYFGRGLFNYWPKTLFNWKGAAEMRDFIWQRSTFMRDRRENPEYTLKDFQGVNVTDKAKVADFMIGLIAGTDDMTNVPLWIEAYTKKLDETSNEQEAVKYADLLVYRIVGSGRKYDMAKIIRGTDMEKVFTKFYSFWNVEHNNWVRELAKQGKEPIANTPRFLGFVASRAIFIYYSALLANQLPGEDEPDDKKAAEILKQYLTYPMSFFPFGREVGTIAIDSVLGLPTFGYRPSPAASLVTDIGRSVGKIAKAARGEGQVQDVMESITKMSSFGFKIPYQVDTWFWNAYDYIVNGMEPTFSDFYRRRPKRKR
ncbi:MAG: hypothetical protein GY797_33370 [Deltaproteobacteria bacterium]|nr:hypothetical protein [Deltaproteobacteria bacterium]